MPETSSPSRPARAGHYETLLLASPTLEKDDLDKAVAKVDATIAKHGGKIVRMTEWGKRRLAFEIKKHTEGHYVLIEFEGPTEIPRRLTEYLRLQQDVLRFMTVRKREFGPTTAAL
jgi:small subunit ribosomal protein S6